MKSCVVYNKKYKDDLFKKVGVIYDKGKSLLDVGCGDGTDAFIFHNKYGLKVSGIDIYEHKNIKKLSFLNFKIGSATEIPFPDESFDYVFIHDVLHHIDEKNQDRSLHTKALNEMGRVLKKTGMLIIVEGNRYNPLFYPHMVLLKGHNHFRQRYFKDIVSGVYPNVKFKFIECHVYPQKFIKFWKLYEKFMESFVPRNFLSYNVAIIRKE